MMGRRHLRGLVRAGFRVYGADPSAASVQNARDELARAGLPDKNLIVIDQVPTEEFDVAIFAETAARRLDNARGFSKVARASRILLEKPLAADPAAVEAFVALFGAMGDSVQVNFARRAWPLVERLRVFCHASQRFDMTVNGGAFGFGCNGIHYLDLFLHFSSTDHATVALAQLSAVPVMSGRGVEYQDFGGRFVVETPRSSLACVGEPTSSAPVCLTIRGDHFSAWIDEQDLLWRLVARDPASRLPNYRSGADYAIQADGLAVVPSLDSVTERWARGDVQMPSLGTALASHRLLHEVLHAGGAAPPYRYT